MKKVIFIHLLNDYSGSPKVLSQVIRAAKKNENDVELYTRVSEDGFLSNLTPKHHFYFYKRFENKCLTLVTFMLSQVSLFFKLLKYKNEDVLIYVNTLLPFGAGLAGKFMKKDVYFHVHETSIQPAVFKKFLRYMLQKTASKVLFVSESLKESESFKNIAQEVIYNAVSNDFLEVATKHQYVYKQDSAFNVLMICSLKAYKGVEEFVTIADLCKNAEDIGFTLLLNAEQSEIDAYFKDRELSSNLTVVSRKKNIIPFYKNASLVMNLSRVDQWVETFGLTIVEAMAFGVPVIVPPVGGPTEIVRDDEEGYLISSYETLKISQHIQELANDEAKCLSLSQNARERVKVFNEAIFEEKITTLLAE